MPLNTALNDDLTKGHVLKGFFQRIKSLIGPESWAKYKYTFVLSGVAAIVETASVAAIIPFIQFAAGKNAPSSFGIAGLTLPVLAAVVITLYVAGIGLRALSLFYVSRVNLRAGYAFSSSLFKRFLLQSYEWHFSRNSSEISAMVLHNVYGFSSNVLIPMGYLLGQSMLVILITIVLLLVQPLATLVFGFGLVLAYISIFQFIKMRLAKQGKIQIESNRQRQRNCNESLLAIRETKLSKLEQKFSSQFSAASERLAVASSQVSIQVDLPKLALESFIFIALILYAVVLIGAEDTGQANLIQNIAVFAVAGLKLFPMGHLVFRNVAILQSGLPVMEKLEKAIAELEPPLQQEIVPKIQREIRLDCISYKYPSGTRPSVKDVSITVKLGDRVAIVGPSGAGKSTLIDLISGLIQPSSGSVLVDGAPLTKERAQSWQDQLQFCPQNPFLFDLSIADNITLDAQYDQERMEKVAALAGIDSFIKTQLDQGYQTETGEMGSRLSGGQIQRISIARTLYKDVPVYIFDEPTSNLDPELANEILDRIFAAKPDAAIVVVTHDPDIAAKCDWVLEMTSPE